MQKIVEIKIRALRESDRVQLARLQDEFLRYNRDELLSGEIKKFEEISDWDLIIKSEFDEFIGKICFVAEVENQLIGFIEGEIREKKWKVRNKQGWIQEFFVTENSRFKGVGVALYDRIVERFVKEGCNALVIGAFSTNTKAIEMYKKFGFVEKNIMLVKNL